MTDDFKNKILEYLTGNIKKEQSPNEPQYTFLGNDTSIIDNKIREKFNAGYSIQGNLGNNDLIVIYGLGKLIEDSLNIHGFIILLDKNFEFVQLIYKYSNGAYFKSLFYMDIDENNNFYGLDADTDSSWEDTNERVFLLNNFTVKLPNVADYSVVLRNSYLIQGVSGVFYDKIVKSPYSASYLMYGQVFDIDTATYCPTGLFFKINVGSANTWTIYSTTTNFCYSFDITVIWNDSSFQEFKILCNSIYPIGSGIGYYTELIGNTLSTNLTTNRIGDSIDSISEYISIDKIVATSYNTSFVILTGGDSSIGIESIYILKIENGIISIIYNDSVSSNNASTNVYTKVIDQEVFLCYDIRTSTLTNPYRVKVGRIYNGQYYGIDITDINYAELHFFVTKEFNLYRYYIPTYPLSKIYKLLEIFNENDYNGAPYNDVNSLNPNSVVLQNISNIAIFARNLYNKSINNSTTTSVVEIPNTYLNDVTVAKELLRSETNQEIIDETKSIEKNIYESILLNFINTITMKNINNPDNVVVNNEGASEINNSISSVNDYDDKKALKLKLYYGDDTSYILDITPGQISYVDNVATYTIALYVQAGKNIVKGQLLSCDESIVYEEISLNLEGGKYYSIIQKVEVN